MKISGPLDVDYEFLARRTLVLLQSEESVEQLPKLLMEELQLSEDDAILTIDRALGGVVRAETGIRENCPDQQLDPIAWHSFQMATKDASIIHGIRNRRKR